MNRVIRLDFVMGGFVRSQCLEFRLLLARAPIYKELSTDDNKKRISVVITCVFLRKKQHRASHNRMKVTQ